MPISNVPGWEQPSGVKALSVPTTAYYAVQVPDDGVNDDTRLLCVLHGWGQNSRSFLRRFEHLRGENIFIVSPQAPHQIYLDMGTKKVGFTWLTTYDRNRAVADLVTLIDGVLAEVVKEFGLRHPPVMLGFSQGVSIAYRYHILAGRAIRGIVACGGDLPPDVHGSLQGAEKIEILLVHGRDDGIVPIAKAEEADGILQERGHAPERLYFGGDHEIPKDVASRIATWVLERS